MVSEILLLFINSTGIGLSLILLIVLFFQKKLPLFFFGLIFLSFFLQLTEEFLWMRGLIQELPHLAEYSEFSIFLIAPSLYLYAYFQKPHPFRPKHLLHFLPAFLVILNFLPLYTSSAEFKLCYISFKITHELGSCSSLYTAGAGAYISEFILDLLNIGQFVLYLILSVPLLKSLDENKRKSTTDLYKRWGRLLFGLCVGAIVFILIDVLWISSINDTFPILYVTAIVLITTFYLLNRSLVLQSNLKANNYSHLKQDESQLIIEKIENHLSREEVFLQHKLTLEQLAHMLEIPRNKISYALQTRGLSFPGLINKRKVDRAKELLCAQEKQSLTLEAIGAEVGFASKATFYKYFKKLVGMTPREYQVQMRSDRPN